MTAHSLKQSAQAALHALGRNRLTASLLVVVTSGAFGAAIAAYCGMDALMHAELPFPHADRLVSLTEFDKRSGEDRRVSFQAFQEWKYSLVSLERLAPYVEHLTFDVTVRGETRKVRGGLGSASLFEILGAEARIGRLFTEDEDQPSGPDVILITEQWWVDAFGRDPDVLGRQVIINQRSYAVIGVLSSSFRFENELRFWLPRPMSSRQIVNNANSSPWPQVIGLLKSGVNLETARQDLSRAQENVRLAFPEMNGTKGATLRPLREEFQGGLPQAFGWCLVAIAVVLAHAGTSLTGLLSADAIKRSVDFAICSALGATRAQVRMVLFLEGLGISVLSVILGFGVASWLLRLLTLQIAHWNSALPALALGWRPIVGAGVSAMVLGIAAAHGPSLYVGNLTGAELLKDHSRIGSRQSNSLGGLILLGEITFTVAFALCAIHSALLMRNLGSPRIGFEPANLLTSRIAVTGSKYVGAKDRNELFRRFGERLNSVHNVVKLGWTSHFPVADGYTPMVHDFADSIAGGERATVPDQIEHVLVGGEYFATLQIPLLAGRLFDAGDNRGPRVAIIEESLARKHYGKPESAVGRRVLTIETEFAEIVGVVRDIHYRNPGRTVRPQVYIPYAAGTIASPSVTLAIRIDNKAPGLNAAIREALRAEDPAQLAEAVRPVENRIHALFYRERIAALVIGVLAFLSTVIGCIGVYGAVVQAIENRRRELAVRLALGAGRSRIVWLCSRRILAILACGAALGTLSGLGLLKVLGSFLYLGELSPPAWLALAPLAVLISGIFAALLPLRRILDLELNDLLRS